MLKHQPPCFQFDESKLKIQTQKQQINVTCQQLFHISERKYHYIKLLGKNWILFYCINEAERSPGSMKVSALNSLSEKKYSPYRQETPNILTYIHGRYNPKHIYLQVFEYRRDNTQEPSSSPGRFKREWCEYSKK